MDNTYKVGEYIILDSGERGEVVEIGVRSTRIKTRDDVIVNIPNSIMANSKIINESAPIPRFRIRVPVGVAYGSNLEKVEEILLAVTNANENIEKHPEPRVRLRTFADSSVNFQLLCWVKDPRDKGLQTHNLLKAAYRAFDEQGINIPFPQRDIHIKTTQVSAFQEEKA
jgi:MscS family membrane protein